MTTTVTIEAHLADTKQVVVKVMENGEAIEHETEILQDGETCSKYTYDSRQVVVEEVEK